MGCSPKSQEVKIGVAFGVGPATRWAKEIAFMEEYAKENNINIQTRLNADEEKKPFKEECTELIDSGINTLIVRARDAHSMKEVVDYAKSKNVKVISYAGLIFGEKIDMFVGYDCVFIGRKMGEYLTETAIKGDYILLSGDEKDKNVSDLLYKGALEGLSPIKDDINVLLDASVPGWSPDEAKKLVKDAITKNNGNVDAILAPNDKVAGACAEVIAELGITKDVAITGMDAELEAVKRILDGTQGCSVYMNSKELACLAVEQAVLLAKGEQPQINTELDNESGTNIPSALITGQLIVKENIDRILIDSGAYTKEEIYG